MTSKTQFTTAFMSGMKESGGDPITALTNVLGILYDTRIKMDCEVTKLREQIGEMDHLADDHGMSYKCKSCGEYFEADVTLSEMAGSAMYCGGSQYCTP